MATAPAWHALLERPGRPGPWGALLDETARAAEDFLRVAESFDDGRFAAERPDPDPDCVSPKAICEHAVYAAWGYLQIVQKGSGQPMAERVVPALPRPADLRPAVREVLRRTEQAVLPLEGLSYDACRAMEVQVRWGPRYDPEMILEHGICHFLRHRRQLERWEGA